MGGFAQPRGGIARPAASCAAGASPPSSNGPAAMSSRSASPSRSPGSGEIEVYATTMPMGQGIATSFAQLVVDVFGVPIEKIRIVHGDTDRGSGFGSAGSRSLFTAGSAIRQASEKAVATGRDLAGDALEAAAADIEYAEGVFRIAGTDRQHRPVRAGRAPAGASHLHRRDEQGGRAELAQRLLISARSRSIRRPAPSRSSPMSRSTMSAGSSIR